MTLSNFTHKFTVNPVSFSTDFDTRINIRKKRETVYFKSNSSSSNVNLAYAQGQEVNSEINLSVIDRSTSLPENRILTNITYQVLEDVSGFTIETEGFLVTDSFTVPVGSEDPIPLFYKHTLKKVLSAAESFYEIKVLDRFFKPSTRTDYLSNLTEGIVYNNFENTYNPISGIADLFYINYSVKNSITGSITSYTELVSNELVYRPATIEDLDEFGNFLPGVKVYIIEEDITANFNIILPSVTDYGVLRARDQRLKVVPPPASGPNDPWFVNIENGAFLATVNTGAGNSIFKYRIAEFLAQNFNPYYPYKFQTETSIRVNQRTIKTLKNKIANYPDEGLYIDVYIYNSSGTLKKAFTSDPDKVGTATFISTVLFSNARLGDTSSGGIGANSSTIPVGSSSIDGRAGFIVIPTGYEINETDIVQTNYYYEEDKYEFTFIDMNPLSDLDLIKQRVVLFLKPEQLGSALEQTLFYLIVNEDGIILDTNYNETGEQGVLSDGIDLQDLTNSGLWYDVDPSTVSWAPSGAINFVQNYTVEGDPNPDSFFILADLFVKESFAPSDYSLTDIRVRGGGITTADQAAALEINPELIWNWDIGIWDGYPYPGAASFFVDVPVNLLTTCSGIFTPDEVREAVEKHMGLGIYPVIWKYNDYEPTITGVNISISGIFISWTQHPDDAYFNIYTSSFPEGPWTEEAIDIMNNSSGNNYSISVPSGITRNVLVAGHKGIDGPICFSGPIDLVDPGDIF